LKSLPNGYLNLFLFYFTPVQSSFKILWIIWFLNSKSGLKFRNKNKFSRSPYSNRHFGPFLLVAHASSLWNWPKSLRPLGPSRPTQGLSPSSRHRATTILPALTTTVPRVVPASPVRGAELPRVTSVSPLQPVVPSTPLPSLQCWKPSRLIPTAGHPTPPLIPLAYKKQLHLAIPQHIALCHSTSQLLAPGKLPSEGFATAFVSPLPHYRLPPTGTIAVISSPFLSSRDEVSYRVASSGELSSELPAATPPRVHGRPMDRSPHRWFTTRRLGLQIIHSKIILIF
jgi:hypothetical protein